MIVFNCTCGWTWIIDLEAAKLIGPVYGDEYGTNKLHIGNKTQPISMGYFRDLYPDCWSQLTDKITKRNEEAK